MNKTLSIILLLFTVLWQDAFAVEYKFNKESGVVISVDNKSFEFDGRCVVIYTPPNPKPAMKNFVGTYRYFSTSWAADEKVPMEKLLLESKKKVYEADGIDARMESTAERRTYDLFYSGKTHYTKPISAQKIGDKLVLKYESNALFDLEGAFEEKGGEISFNYILKPKKEGYYSVGYLGAPSVAEKKMDEVWQPMVWQQKWFPEQSFISQAFQCPLPMSMVTTNGYTIGVLVPSKLFKFEPLPTHLNSTFGVAVRNEKGDAQPMVFSPVLGGVGSKMNMGDKYSFEVVLKVANGGCQELFRSTATADYGFKDYRSNALGSLNGTIDNMIDYSLSSYSCFIDSLRGYSYATDVPGSVKNVSLLNALDISIVTDNQDMFFHRARPMVEFMLSRKKILFNLDRAIKVQNPSRSMGGPCATPNEMIALNMLNGGVTPYINEMAYSKMNLSGKTEQNKISNLSWMNAMVLYKSTKDQRFLEQAIKDADIYIKENIDTPREKQKNAFFWSQFAPLFMPLYEMYDITGDKKYLEASRKAANYYAMFIWMSPQIPDSTITVNKGGVAPLYGYLKSKGHRKMLIPEEQVEAWRVSEIGLLPESSTTSIGHRGVFMAHHAPFMMKIAAATGDKFLHDIARSAIIGRYTNFPGYHMNSVRTTVYEKADYPLRGHKDLGYNSMHYNHILPMVSLLIDYIVSDVEYRSKGEIKFASYFNEGYAYLVNNLYGNQKGVFYGQKGVNLWMPKALIRCSSKEVNYLSGYDDSNLYVAFTNESDIDLTSKIEIARLNNRNLKAEVWKDNKRVESIDVKNGEFKVNISAKGLTAVIIKEAKIKPAFSDRMFNDKDLKQWSKAYLDIKEGNSTAFILDMGKDLRSAYLYLRDDESKVSSAWIEYRDKDGVLKKLIDNSYPYEFSVELPFDATQFVFDLYVKKNNGEIGSQLNNKLCN